MKQTKLSQVFRWGIPAIISIGMMACGTPKDDPSSSSSSSSSSALSSTSVSSSQSNSSVSSAPANDIAQNGGVESGTTNWAARGDASIQRTTAEKYSGSASLLVTGRTDYWQGTTFNVGQLTPGNSYEVSVWVKLAAGEPAETLKITGKVVDDADDETYLEYTEIASATISSSEWMLLSGTYVPDSEFDYFIIESFEGSENVDFYADAFVVAGEVDPVSSSSSSTGNSSSSVSSVDPNRKGLSALTSIPFGVAVNLEGGSRDTLNSNARTTIVRDNFSQVSVENSMKMSYWDESSFSNSRVDNLISSLVQPAGLNIHGHTMVWHRSYQLPSWADDNNNNFLQDYIRHIEGIGSKYKDYIVSWDVVNEGLYDSADDGDNGPNGSGGANDNGVNYRKSVFYRKLGADYIAEAFKAADRVTDADLYYNDFNTENAGNDSGENKTTWLVNMVTQLVQDGVPIDGVGFQMHVLPDWPSISTIKQSWQRVLDINDSLKIKITELDVRVNNQYSDPPQVINSCNNCPELQNQKQRYKDIVEAYFETVPAHRRGGITIWGISDPDSWFAQDPDWPLLWDGNLNPKPAFEGVQEALESAN